MPKKDNGHKEIPQLIRECLAHVAGTRNAAIKLIPVTTDKQRLKHSHQNSSSDLNTPEFRSLFQTDPNDPYSLCISVDAGLIQAAINGGAGTPAEITAISITATGDIKIEQGSVSKTLSLSSLISTQSGNQLGISNVDNKLYVQASTGSGTITHPLDVVTVNPAVIPASTDPQVQYNAANGTFWGFNTTTNSWEQLGGGTGGTDHPITVNAGAPTVAPAATDPRLYFDSTGMAMYGYNLATSAWVNLNQSAGGITRYATGNGNYIVGTSGITVSAPLGGQITVNIPAGGIFLGGHLLATKADATYAAGPVIDGLRVRLINGDGSPIFMNATLKSFVAPVSTSNPVETVTTSTVTTSSHEAGATTDVIFHDVVSQMNSAHNDLVIILG